MSYELEVRLGFFLLILVTVSLWELLAPMRRLKISKQTRWINNLLLVFLNTLLLRLIFPTAAVGVAVFCQHYNLGLLNITAIPIWLKVLIAFLVLDFTIYLQHVLFHYLPLLWRFHKVHHIDLDYDVTTGLRFHPVEIFLSMLIKFMIVFLVGAPVSAVIIFEIVLNGTSLFNHGNIRLPRYFDKFLRLFMVTPDTHRVHHSTIPKETNSNFGFNLIWWDKLMGTYLAQPKKGHIDMDIGLSEYTDPKQTQNLISMLKIPFSKK
ncbi:sterol desaturase family protein [Francisella tularensis]|uniref:sterol desaturase family protein n=1 Tax=Francisella tularensis TaxID=263 RepID=UPI0000F5928C|nr:sterol desaturase family protein [Francisella tularensis]ABO47074.1 sterol desaturase [Francisella tularensis subsp. tularensis WY96-3418]AJI62204.1 fatty acid hydroxylase superfamily protein [Francisella tularensis subsp. tularensis]AKH91833.1 sterol desaturase [Francisella tularensis subsp. tularensis WY-00W4114]AKU73598.1 fatty acid hydroxylase superfamily protein [Francisella tularensis subsp. tularensis]EKM86183.1 sterol desaturase [Francisella tularensis subsp. tularensis AS_713]